jgi:hypothetical protein
VEKAETTFGPGTFGSGRTPREHGEIYIYIYKERERERNFIPLLDKLLSPANLRKA